LTLDSRFQGFSIKDIPLPISINLTGISKIYWNKERNKREQRDAKKVNIL
jgi:hypothetical protein